MLGWLVFAGVTVATLTLLVATGYPLSRIILYRSHWSRAAVISPFVAVTVLSVLAVLYPIWGVAWTATNILVPVICQWLPASLCIWWLCYRQRHSLPVTGRFPWLLALVLAGVSAVFVTFIVSVYGVSDAMSQTFDAAYHLNQSQWFIDRANGSSFEALMLQPHNPRGFYPSAWHDLVSAVAMMGHVNVLVATNVVMLVVIAVMWPIGIGLSTWVISKGNTQMVVLALLSSMVIPQFPYLLMVHGILYPTVLSFAIVPVVFAFSIRFAQLENLYTTISSFFVVLILLPGMALAHPSTVFLYLVAVVPIIALAIWQALHKVWPQINAIVSGSIATITTLTVLLLCNYLSMKVPQIASLRTSKADWEASHAGMAFRAIRKILQGYPGLPWSYVNWRYAIPLQLIVFLGLWMLWKKRQVWIIGSYICLQALVWAGLTISGDIRAYLVGVWYGDTIRIASGAVFITVICFAYGMEALVKLLASFIGIEGVSQRTDGGTIPMRHIKRLRLVIIGAVIPMALISPHIVITNANAKRFFAYDQEESGTGKLVNHNEKVLLERLPKEVPEGYVVIGNPWDGSTMVQAIANRPTLYPHVQPPADPDALYLAENLNRAQYDPKVCDIVRRYHVGYVLDFGSDYLWGMHSYPRRKMYYGLSFLESGNVATPIDQEGKARLLKITACGDIQPQHKMQAEDVHQ